MSYINQAVMKAMEQGYGVDYPIREDHRAVWCDHAFLDPFFWKTLGKALEWGSFYDDEGTLRIYTGQGWYPDTHNLPSGSDEMMWQAQWHRFIDHLASGKGAESFFENIIKI